tara:strand:- start:2384 stop:2686 length:303 start_codon:yes stop_codon:yes gene_type:complete
MKKLNQFSDLIHLLVAQQLEENKTKETDSKTESIKEKLKEDAEYQKFFKSAMNKFDIKSPKDLKGQKKAEFFDYVDQNYKAKSESNVSEDYKRKKIKPIK